MTCAGVVRHAVYGHRVDRRCQYPGCSAVLYSGNPYDVCDCHPQYNPAHDPHLYDRLICFLQAHAGDRCDPCSHWGIFSIEGHRTIRKQVEKARRHGHTIFGYRGGGYRWLSGPEEE
jgi:hypothetical protein